MEIKEGMYVRFKTLSDQVKIGQIKEIDNIIYNLDNNEVTSDKYIMKAGNKIGDVVETGDIAVMLAYGLPIFKQISESDLLEIKFGNYEVINIMSKEQFEKDSYKVV